MCFRAANRVAKCTSARNGVDDERTLGTEWRTV